MTTPSLQVCQFQIHGTRRRNTAAEREIRLRVENARQEFVSVETELRESMRPVETELRERSSENPLCDVVCVRCRRAPREVMQLCCWGVSFCTLCERRSRVERHGRCGVCGSAAERPCAVHSVRGCRVCDSSEMTLKLFFDVEW